MATSAGSYYATEPTLIDFTKIDPAPGVFPVKMRVKLNNGKIAVYAIAGGAIGPGVSGSAGALDVSGTTSASAGPYLSMAAVTTSAGEYFWVRSSADEVYP